MKDPRRASADVQRNETTALAISVVWLLLVQLACVLLWDAGWLTRQAALLHWLVIGVLPPALALWGMERPAPE
jgi:hypothetical protein